MPEIPETIERGLPPEIKKIPEASELTGEQSSSAEYVPPAEIYATPEPAIVSAEENREAESKAAPQPIASVLESMTFEEASRTLHQQSNDAATMEAALVDAFERKQNLKNG